MRQPGTISFVFGCIFACIFVLWGADRIYQGIQYDRAVGGHLKRAADANTIALAKVELKAAIVGMDARGLTCTGNQIDLCYTSVLYTTPDEDVGYWRLNIKETLRDLEQVPEGAGHLLISNTLMRVRESLLDAENGGDVVTAPSGISVYPNNHGFAFWGGISLLGWGLLWGVALRDVAV